MARLVLVRKRGTRKDGCNCVTTCTVCPGSKADVSGVGGVSRERALELKAQHEAAFHGGRKTI
jgi:hypothetical protein